MRQRLVQVLRKDDRDEPMDALVRRFWMHSRTSALLPNTNDPTRARVVDLASWVRARGKRSPS
jgi:hypothetical protein